MINTQTLAHYETEAGFRSEKANIPDTSVVFVNEDKEIYTHGEQYTTKYPQAYGIEWVKQTSTPYRIGNMENHKKLPIQSAFKPCICQGNKIMYYLNPTDLTKKIDGTDSRLDGYDGVVRIEIPKFYLWEEFDDTKKRVYISTVKYVADCVEIPHCVIDAFRPTVLRSVPSNMGYLSTLAVNSMVSIINTNTYCRGGNNVSTNDGVLSTEPFKTNLGKPATSMNRGNARKYADQAGGELLNYEIYKAVFCWCYVIEYCNFNMQATFNAQLTAEGFHQGGLGASVTNWSSANWESFNNYNPITPCGYLIDVAAETGIKALTVEGLYTSYPHKWRNFENIFGDIWIILDGVTIDAYKVYSTTDKCYDELTSSKLYRGTQATSGYIIEFVDSPRAEIIAGVANPNSTAGYKYDYNWSDGGNNRLFLAGARAYDGGRAGGFSLYSDPSVSLSYLSCGFRSLSRMNDSKSEAYLDDITISGSTNLIMQSSNETDRFSKNSVDSLINYLYSLSLKEQNVLLEDKYLKKSDASAEYLLAYGIEWTASQTSPTPTRCGNPLLHKSLPIQSQIRGCIEKNGKVVYWLDPNDWNKKEDGTASVLDGTDGSVRVHIPKFYYRSWTSPKYKVMISTQKIDDSWIEFPEMFLDAYQAALDRTNSKLMSVVNTTEQFRGGNNATTWDAGDDIYRRNLGKAATNFNRATARTYAANNGSYVMNYEVWKMVMVWLPCIEYCTFHLQNAFNANLTSEGYHQGGLGPGMTSFSNWSYYNDYNPVNPCGYTNSLGNFSGQVAISIPAFTGTNGTSYGATTHQVNRYRGIENPFGNIWMILDGVIVDSNHSDFDLVYTCKDPTKFGDSITEDYKLTSKSIHTDGYVLEVDLGEDADITAISVGASTTTGKCDYHWTGNVNSTLRCLLAGATADLGGYAGGFSLASSTSVSYSNRLYGFRTMRFVE